MRVFLEPVSDPYGYDAYRLMRSKVVPTGLAIFVLGLALGAFSLWLPPIRDDDAHAIAQELSTFVGTLTGGVVTLDFADNNALISLVVMIFLVIGAAMLGYARNNRRNYMTAYPRIKDFYSDDQKRQALRLRRRWIAAGGAVMVVGAGLGLLAAALVRAAGIDLGTNRGRAIPLGVFLLLSAPGVWMIAHGVVVGDRVDVFEYNYQALALTNRYDIRVNQSGERRRVMLGENRIETFCAIVGRCAVALGFFATVMLAILPSLRTPYAIVPLAFSLVMWYVVYKVGEEIARHRFEVADPEARGIGQPFSPDDGAAALKLPGADVPNPPGAAAPDLPQGGVPNIPQVDGRNLSETGVPNPPQGDAPNAPDSAVPKAEVRL